MNPLTYLGFTIFSIIMQFCVMEFIHERFQLDKDSSDFNESNNKDNDLIKGINRKPHALFYRSETDKLTFEAYNDEESTRYSNTSLEDAILTSTEISSTTYEVYYENTSVIDDYFTTESYSTSSEFDNVTEITFFDKNNTSTAKPGLSKKVNSEKNCFCNLLYQKCDINCCCDTDCTEEERSLFKNCVGDKCGNAKNELYLCSSYPTCSSSIQTDVFNHFFCVAKVNLPDKRIKSHFQLDTYVLSATFKWNSIHRSDVPLHYKKNKYKYGDPIWLLKNGVTSTLSLPTTVTNYYCNGKKQIVFLENESVKCYVKIKDLYMFSTLKTLEGTKLISPTDFSMNTTVLNCSTLHCTNWTILACYDICDDYNKTIHTPVCKDNYCDNLAHAIEYTFYYFESKIINATLKMYLSKVPMSIQFLKQKITVKWYLGNESIDEVIQLSGNPGYVKGLPLIVSYAPNNHSRHFYNRTYGKSVLQFPGNVNGLCKWLSSENKTLLFGLNTRLKCRLNIKQDVSPKNATRACQAIQANIKERLILNQKLLISPYGNPRNISDEKWIPLEINDRTFLYGEYRLKNSRLVCYNLVTQYGFVIAFADTSNAIDGEENKIVKAGVGVTCYNVTFDLAHLSTVLTIDVRFIDISKPVIEFARAPNLNIQLPADFFFDYPSNSYRYNSGIVLVLHCSIILLMTK